MVDKQFILVAYDISNDRRRTKLHDRLEGFGTPVQYSVFECLLEPGETKKMKAMVRKTVRPRLDHVRFYTLCEGCRGKIDIIGRIEAAHEAEVLVVGGEAAKPNSPKQNVPKPEQAAGEKPAG
jgi:CRISPR-associated protein Cas2